MQGKSRAVCKPCPPNDLLFFDSQAIVVLDLQEPAEKIANLLDLSRHHQGEILAL